MTRVTLRAKSDGTEVSGELEFFNGLVWVARLASGTAPIAFYNSQWDRVYALPTTPGTVFRATVRGVPNIRVMVDNGANPTPYAAPLRPRGHFWHRAEHIDASTVRIELEGDDD